MLALPEGSILEIAWRVKSKAWREGKKRPKEGKINFSPHERDTLWYTLERIPASATIYEDMPQRWKRVFLMQTAWSRNYPAILWYWHSFLTLPIRHIYGKSEQGFHENYFPFDRPAPSLMKSKLFLCSWQKKKKIFFEPIISPEAKIKRNGKSGTVSMWRDPIPCFINENSAAQKDERSCLKAHR